MKRVITIIALMCMLPFYGQKQIAKKVNELVAKNTVFRNFSPFKVNNKDAVSAAVKNATYVSMDAKVVNAIANTKPEFIELDIPYNSEVLHIQLYKVKLSTDGFHVDTNGKQNVSLKEGAHYRGIIKGEGSTLASFSFFTDEMSGIISGSNFNNLVVGKMQNSGNVSDYIIYSDRQLTKANTFTCGTADVPNFGKKEKKKGFTTKSGETDKCVTIYFEVDYEIYLQNGQSMQATTNWVEGIFNNIQTLYANDGMNVALHSIFIWSQQDPYFGDDSEDYLMQFLQSASFEANVGQLIGIDEGGLGGLAPLGGLCSQYNMSYVDVQFEYEDVPLFSWNVEAMTHELGHQFGSPHTHACEWNGNETQIDACGDYAGNSEGDCNSGILPQNQGTIMSYCHLLQEVGINLANGFGPQPTALMQDFIEFSSCVGTGCIGGPCLNTVSELAVSNITASTATISWTSESEGPWEISFTAPSASFNLWNPTTSNNVNITGMDPNTYYVTGVREVCEDNTSQPTKVLFASDADWCAGQVYTDSGNTIRNYGDNEHIVRVFKPANPEQKVKVLFTQFDTEQGYDILNVYRGSVVNVINRIGSYSGNVNIPLLQSTAADGALTFEFISDESVNETGWTANVSCTALVVTGMDDIAVRGLYYYPNPSTGMVTVKADEEISQISVYNVAGQLLLSAKAGATETTVDLSPFANGIYFFKAVGNNSESNFRIIKQ
ncbi:M12 family metallo-peptidase [Flavobacterium hauense]